MKTDKQQAKLERIPGPYEYIIRIASLFRTLAIMKKKPIRSRQAAARTKRKCVIFDGLAKGC